jgi:hypothetical protein
VLVALGASVCKWLIAKAVVGLRLGGDIQQAENLMLDQ